MSKPLLICLTPVRNEAWILKAFLEATSLWADRIIIADQGSTDKSREIALGFSKVILIDNTDKDMHQARARKLLFDEAMKINGDKILFALDADEFLSGNFQDTEGWKTITDSCPDTAFCFRWMNMRSDLTTYNPTNKWMYWALHGNASLDNTIYPDNYIHEWRLPFPNKPAAEKQINDICFIHFAKANAQRQKNKELFYQIITMQQQPATNTINLFRLYNSAPEAYTDFPPQLLDYYKKQGNHILESIDFDDEGNHYLKSATDILLTKGISYFTSLNIWDSDLLKTLQIKDPRPLGYKILHGYLNLSRNYSQTILVRMLDKLLKKVIP